MTCDQSHQQSRRSAAVAHVERGGGLEQSADANALDLPLTVAQSLDTGAHGPHRGGSGEHVLTLKQT